VPRARLPMRKILEILRLKFEHGLSGRAIALAVCAALSTVQECLRRFSTSGLVWPITLDETALEALLYPREVVVDQTLPDFAAVEIRLRSFKGMTRERVWQAYRMAQPEGLSYSAFCASFARFLGLQKMSAKQFHAPGSAMFVDYAGPALFITDRHTSVRTAVRVFVAAMGYSHAIYAHATPGERTLDWLNGHVHALTYFGGVPEKIVPDNGKGVVSKACRYEPVLNPAYIEFARHYDCAVVPARVRRPQDKAKVENAVQILERALFPNTTT
jgi:transposase